MSFKYQLNEIPYGRLYGSVQIRWSFLVFFPRSAQSPKRVAVLTLYWLRRIDFYGKSWKLFCGMKIIRDLHVLSKRTSIEQYIICVINTSVCRIIISFFFFFSNSFFYILYVGLVHVFISRIVLFHGYFCFTISRVIICVLVWTVTILILSVYTIFFLFFFFLYYHRSP